MKGDKFMNIENHIAMKIYQLLLSIRDSVEYALLDTTYKPHIFYLRKSLFEEALKEGPFVEMLKENKEAGQKVYNNLYNMYRDIFVDCKYLKVEDDCVSRFDQDNQELLEQLVANYYVVYEIFDYNINIFKNLAMEIRKLSISSHKYFVILYAYVLLVNILQQKNLSLLTKNEQNYISIVTLFYFFKDRAKTDDDKLNDILENIERLIVMFSVDSKDEDVVTFISSLYEKMDNLLKEKEQKWQQDYQKTIQLFKEDNDYNN